MKKELHFYYCPHCGNLVEALEESGVRMVCCGHEMLLLTPGTTDASKEKHVPQAGYDKTINHNYLVVQVGEDLHPQVPDHHIDWVQIETNQRTVRIDLKNAALPVARFLLDEGELVHAVYAFCNIHGLWVKKL